MFWDKGYAPSQNIEALLEKENVTVEEFLDEDDILQECKTLKKSIVNYFTRPDVIRRLVELITTEPSEELPLAQRFRHANMACEILTLGIPSLNEKLLSDEDTLKLLYSYLENEPPLNPLLSSFFSKTFSMLFKKKTEQDWFLYQQMCLKLLENIKSHQNFLDLICKHFSTPVVPDLILEMMRDVDGGDIKRNLYEWLTEEKLVERLIGILGNSNETDKHENVAEFLCDLIQHGRSMRQAEQENGSFEPAFNGSNPLLQNLESEATIEALLNVILDPNAMQGSIVAGITVVLTLLNPVTFIDEPNSERLKFIQDREKEINEHIVSTVIRVIAPRLKHFNELLKNPPKKPHVVINAGTVDAPLGNTRLHVCRLFTVLLQTRKPEVTEAICEIDFFETVLALFQKYCWNNFLHTEVEKYFDLIFGSDSGSGNNSNNISTHASDGSCNGKTMNEEDEKMYNFDSFANLLSSMYYPLSFKVLKDADEHVGIPANSSAATPTDNTNCNAVDNMANEQKEVTLAKEQNTSAEKSENTEDAENAANEVKSSVEAATADADTNATTAAVKEEAEEGTTVTEMTATDATPTTPLTTDSIALAAATEANSNEIESPQEGAQNSVEQCGPSPLQKHLIVDCKIISKLLACWMHNDASEKSEKHRRLGYMGHLLKILKHIRNCISEYEHIGALIEANLADVGEVELWQQIMNTEDGELTKATATQCRLLANCNPHELAKDCPGDNQDISWTYSLNWDSQIVEDTPISSHYPTYAENMNDQIIFPIENSIPKSMNDLNMIEDDNETSNFFQFLRNRIGDGDDDDEHANNEDNTVGGGANMSNTVTQSDFFDRWISLVESDTFDMFVTSAGSSGTTSTLTNSSTATTAALAAGVILPPADAWADFANEQFADFDAHFNSFANDMGDAFDAPTDVTAADITKPTNTTNDLNFVGAKQLKDNNANLEKMTAFVVDKCVDAVVGDANKFSDDEGNEHADDDDDEDIVLHIVKNDSVDEPNLAATIAGTPNRATGNDADDDDDYDDDEGMWTKPLGGGNSGSDGDNVNANANVCGSIEYVTNGPSKDLPLVNDFGPFIDATKQLNIPIDAVAVASKCNDTTINASCEQSADGSTATTLNTPSPTSTQETTMPPTTVI